MKDRSLNLCIVLLCFIAALGCGGDSSDEDSLTAGSEDASGDLGEALEDVSLEPEPQAGDFVCEETDVFIIGNGGVKVFVKTCEEGLSCVPEAEDGCACVPDCENKTCGDDGCGGTCGACTNDLLCHTDGVCRDSCLPEGDGKAEGNHIRQMSWQIPPTGGFNLHDMCQSQDVIVIVEVAGR